MNQSFSLFSVESDLLQIPQCAGLGLQVGPPTTPQVIEAMTAVVGLVMVVVVVVVLLLSANTFYVDVVLL